MLLRQFNESPQHHRRGINTDTAKLRIRFEQGYRYPSVSTSGIQQQASPSEMRSNPLWIFGKWVLVTRCCGGANWIRLRDGRPDGLRTRISARRARVPNAVFAIGWNGEVHQAAHSLLIRTKAKD